GGELLFRTGCILAGAALAVIAFFLTGAFFPLALALLAVGEYFILVYTVEEFEYSFVDGELTVELIRGKRKRRKLFSCSCRDISRMAPVPAGGPEKTGFAAVRDVSAYAGDKDGWFFTAESQKGKTLVIFSPNERMLGAFREYLGRKMEY
ncbi:MAG: hypothetical protein ILP09_05950, partial [Oscillospiraceae bacterium]|nr:hypothetical protein [Oscillospiraceae bacterium]